jgi:STE24 endopeptidase
MVWRMKSIIVIKRGLFVMKKVYLTFFICFVAYAIGIVIYFYSTPTTVPLSYQGSPADPTTFMSKEQLNQAHSYSVISYLTYFLEFPLDWLLLISIMGWSVWLRDFVEKSTRFFFIQTYLTFFISLHISRFLSPILFWIMNTGFPMNPWEFG